MDSECQVRKRLVSAAWPLVSFFFSPTNQGQACWDSTVTAYFITWIYGWAVTLTLTLSLFLLFHVSLCVCMPTHVWEWRLSMKSSWPGNTPAMMKNSKQVYARAGCNKETPSPAFDLSSWNYQVLNWPHASRGYIKVWRPFVFSADVL